jgi:tetratricopeptide (TPR) repeat protein
LRLSGKKIKQMKKQLFLLFFLTQMAFCQGVFEASNAAYKKGNYQEAIAGYESILKAKKQSAEIYFNLGNCYYKLNKVAPAIYYYEKALQLNPNDAEIATNLKFAQKLQIDDIKIVQQVGFSKIIKDFTTKYHYNTWAWMAVGLAFLFLLLFVGYYFAQKSSMKRMYFTGMTFVLLFILMAIGAAVYEKKEYETDNPAIVFTEITTVKSEPKATASNLFVLHEGTKVQLLETVDDWKKIQLQDERKGWILASAVKAIK